MAGSFSKTLTAFVIDAGSSMGKNLMIDNHMSTRHSSSFSKLEMCKSFLNTYMCMRCAESKTVEFSACTFGQDHTANHNHLIEQGYEHVNEIFPMGHPAETDYHLMRELEPGTDDDKADLVSAFVVAYDALVNAHKKLSYNRVLVLLTDAESQFCESDDDFDTLDQVIAMCKDSDDATKRQPITIHVLVLGRCRPNPPASKPIEVDKNSNVGLLKEIASNTGGMYCEADDMGTLLWGLSKGIGLAARPMISKTVLRFPLPGLKEEGDTWGQVCVPTGNTESPNGSTSLDIPISCWTLTQARKPNYVKAMKVADPQREKEKERRTKEIINAEKESRHRMQSHSNSHNDLFETAGNATIASSFTPQFDPGSNSGSAAMPAVDFSGIGIGIDKPAVDLTTVKLEKLDSVSASASASAPAPAPAPLPSDDGPESRVCAAQQVDAIVQAYAAIAGVAATATGAGAVAGAAGSDVEVANIDKESSGGVKRSYATMEGVGLSGGVGVSAYGGGGDIDIDDVDQEPVIPKEIKRQTEYAHPTDPDEEVSIENFVEGYQYGAYYVPVDAGSKSAMTLDGPGGLTVIGSLPVEQIPRHHFMDVATVVQGSDLVPESMSGIAAIAIALRETSTALIVRRVSKDNTDPYLAVLMVPKTDNNTLILHHLPCLDDSRSYWFHSLPQVAQKPVYAKGVEAVSSFVDALTLQRVNARQLTPANISYYRLYADITARMLHTSPREILPAKDSLHVPLAELLQSQPQSTESGASSSSSSQSVKSKLAELRSAVESISASFPLKKVESQTGAKPAKVFFSDLQMESASGVSGI